MLEQQLESFRIFTCYRTTIYLLHVTGHNSLRHLPITPLAGRHAHAVAEYLVQLAARCKATSRRYTLVGVLGVGLDVVLSLLKTYVAQPNAEGGVQMLVEIDAEGVAHHTYAL